MIVISACLVGEKVRYDGNHKLDLFYKNLIDEKKAISICPEILGGLQVPREPAEIIGGDGYDVWNDQAKVMTVKGRDVTIQFKEGAKRALSIIKDLNANTVILKSDSPSCGSTVIYDGTFTGNKKEGVGVTTALFTLNDINVYDEKNFLTIFDNHEV
ncbi:MULTISPECIES: 2-thiouracil desulfurase family protein [Mammaliicoccus]|uniref:DUF523 domain-containing protein n=2 Tax=Mammaliicoccus sciuri TaxID=1296 RepID=A0AAW5LIZ3_MAMSC|nr:MULTISPECIES: DUF523 domain-containing protein [Mammaliicoccus]KTT83689.1 hypothetical protein NS202_04700 [Mammaliicoccus sciuri]MBA1395703.1 DUF523 domain-containing protein [Mammaliicoccus sciuri]MBF0720670.1 DUF523 domain-containing protein [Mammaliicoccus sciuri]MBF0772744.1 DUF523 domain-containing protein [Mammaliicoccus sciuri]MBG9205774.1 DUF523 domain-containing protein [Mammaliicoccus sciuri]